MYNDKKGAPFKLTHPVFRAVQSGGVSQLHFDAGGFNFYDADGSAKNYDFTIAQGAGPSTLFAVHKDASAKVANINVRSRSAKTTVLVDGGELTAATKFNIPTQAGSTDKTAVDVIVVSNGVIRIGEMVLGYSGFPRDIMWRVADGGRVVFEPNAAYKFSQHAYTTSLDLDVRDGGTVEVGHEVAFGWSAGAKARIHLTNANWLVSKETKIGGDFAGVDAIFAATNSFIDSYRGVVAAQMRVNGTLLLKECVWTNAFVNACPANTDPTIKIEGGTWTSLKRFWLGGGAQGGTLLVEGGSHKLCEQVYLGYNPNANVPTKSTWTIRGTNTAIEFASGEMMALGWNGQADVNLESGTILCTGVGGLSQGHAGSDSSSTFTMSGGAIHAPTPTVGIAVGRAGSGHFIQNAGDILLKQMYLGHEAKADAAETCVFTQNGGTFTATDALGITVAVGQGRRARVILNGGEMQTPKLAGGAGAAVKGGTGWAALQANGGTLKASAASTTFVADLDEVELGANGLCVDTDYAVTITSALTSADDVKGLLVKRGSGMLTLAGTLADTIRIEVQEGKVVFGQSATLDALTLGTENSAGAIELATGVTLGVTGVVTINHNASTQEVVFEKDESNVTHVTIDDSTAETLEIRLDEAVTSNATESVGFRVKDTLNVSVVPDGTLNLSGKLERGTFVMKGAGHAVLEHTSNEFYGGVTLESGWLSFTDLRALGLTFADAATLALKSGTLEYTGTVAAAIPALVSMSAASTTTPVVMKTSGDLAFGPFSAMGGALIKAGPGKITLAAKDGNTVVKSGAGIGTGANGCPKTSFALDSDGGAPTGEYAALNVAEGELVLKGSGTVKSAGGVVSIGLNTAVGDAQPTLTVDGTYLDNNMHFFVGGNIGASAFATNATLQIINGGKMRCDTLRVGTFTSSKPSYPEVRVNGGTLDCGFRLNCADEQTWTHARYLFENGASLKIGSYNYSSWQLWWDGDATFTFDASSYAIAGNNHYADVYVQQAGRGLMLFRNNSMFYGQKITKVSGDNHKLTVAFDQGEWIPGTDDYDFTFRGGLGIIVDCRAGGLTLNVPSSKTWKIGQKFSGEGGIVKKGAGTLVFTPQATIIDGTRTSVTGDPISWAFAETLNVEAGTLSVSNAAAPASASVELAAGTLFNPDSALVFGEVSGRGTISGGGLVSTAFRAGQGATLTLTGVTLTAPTFKLAVDEAGAVTGRFALTNCVCDGQVIVDCGRSALDPLAIKTTYEIGTVSGTIPDFTRWRAVNTGIVQGVGSFSVEDGKILMMLKRSGFQIILR